MKKWTKVLIASVIMALAASSYILYYELTNHAHDLTQERIINDLPAIDVPDIEETTDFVHALADLAAAASPFLVPIVGWWVFHKTKGKVVANDQA